MALTREQRNGRWLQVGWGMTSESAREVWKAMRGTTPDPCFAGEMRQVAEHGITHLGATHQERSRVAPAQAQGRHLLRKGHPLEPTFWAH